MIPRSKEGAASAALPSRARWAARYLTFGLNVIPIKYGADGAKRPAIKWSELQDVRMAESWSTDDLEKYVQTWWGDERSRFQIAVVTGRYANLVVVDCDDDDAFRFLGTSWHTPIVRTGKGWHVWFAHPGELRGKKVRAIEGVNLDVRADHGYVLAPPSVHPSGRRYEWVKDPRIFWPPAEMPSKLVSLLWPPPPPPPPATATATAPHGTAYAAAALAGETAAVRTAPSGTRNDTLNRAAFALGRLVADGELDASETHAALLQAASACGLSEFEALSTIRSGLRARGIA